MSALPTSLPTVRSVPLEGYAQAYPQVRFAVRFADGRLLGHDAGHRHPLAGTGGLWLALVVDALAERDPALLGERLVLGAEHRAAARLGTLRRMGGDLRLTVGDAMTLLLGTGDGMCALAVLGLVEARDVDVVGVARELAAGWGLEDTELTGAGEAAWGGGLTGHTTPTDLAMLLEGLSGRVLGWMRQAFEPAGLASGLPGFGPRMVGHATVAGWELLGGTGGARPTGTAGAASVLVLDGAVVAAYHSGLRADGTPATGLEVSTALGTLGLAVCQTL